MISQKRSPKFVQRLRFQLAIFSRLAAAVVLLALLVLGDTVRAASTSGAVKSDLEIHLAQANNDSPYAFVRAKFEPGEITDPWAARFYDEAGAEIPFFVWDSVSWRVAREGREDWGKRFALIQHAPGDAPEAIAARQKKLEWAKASLPALGAKLAAEDAASERTPDSVCAAIYLLRFRVPPFGKVRIHMQMLATPKATPERQEWHGNKVEQRVAIACGDLAFRGLPDQMTVFCRDAEMFQVTGFNAGGASGETSHADPARPYSIEKTSGIITKVIIKSQTNGRNNAPMDWQCSYWMFPEGGYVALEGFSIGDPAGYTGGPQKLSLWKAPMGFTMKSQPSWETPWWIHQSKPNGYVATHLLNGVSLATGYGNNPYSINAEGNGREPEIQSAGEQLALRWRCQINDPAEARVHSPEPVPRPGVPPDSLQPAPVEWKPKIDWLYRQYLVGLASGAEASQSALRKVLGASAGWIDRPLDEETAATRVVDILKKMPIDRTGTEFDQLIVASPMVSGDIAAAKNYLSRARNQAEKADFYIATMRDFVARGGKPAGGSHVDPDGVRREGFTGNPCYFAHLLPAYLRVFDFFELNFPHEEYRRALTRFADFTMESIGGKPFDLQKWNTTLEQEWPSRVVPAIPLMIGADTVNPDPQYRQAATILFDVLRDRVKKNPHV